MENTKGPVPVIHSAGVVRSASAIVIASSVVAFLYLGRSVLEPLALAILLAFVLAPPVRWLRGHGIGRIGSVATVVLLTLGVIIAVGVLIESEIMRLASEIPQYQNNLRQKAATVHNALIPSGSFKRASTTLNGLAAELKDRPSTDNRNESGPAAGQAPVPVTLEAPQPATLEYLENLIGPFVTPMTTAGLLLLFLIFILMSREDLRDRVLRLAGTRDLYRTTEAMNDAGQRLSRFFLIQSAINGSFGFLIFLGLWAIGVPSAPLWGVLAAILRFIPYVGTPIAAVFPLLLAAAIDPGWSKAIETGALFLLLELIAGQAIEPVLQGQQTGLSPVAIVICQLFWTLIWGAPGLLLAVPVTVCIAVLGRHIEALSFIGVLLGDEPALAPFEAFYQRLLAADATEASYQAEGVLKKDPLSNYYDSVPMEALALAQRDAVEGKLSVDRQLEVTDTIEEIVENLAEYTHSADTAQTARIKASDDGSQEVGDAEEGVAGGSRKPFPVLLIAARSPIDQSACILLADILQKYGLEPTIEPYSTNRLRKNYKPSAGAVKFICVSYFSTSPSPAPVRYLIRKLRSQVPEIQILACFWGLGADAAKLEELQENVGADFAAGSLKEAAAICLEEAAAFHRDPPATDKSTPNGPAQQQGKILDLKEA